MTAAVRCCGLSKQNAGIEPAVQVCMTAGAKLPHQLAVCLLHVSSFCEWSLRLGVVLCDYQCVQAAIKAAVRRARKPNV